MIKNLSYFMLALFMSVGFVGTAYADGYNPREDGFTKSYFVEISEGERYVQYLLNPTTMEAFFVGNERISLESIIVPEKITHDGKEYTVTKSDILGGIISLPATVTDLYSYEDTHPILVFRGNTLPKLHRARTSYDGQEIAFAPLVFF